MTTPVGPTDGTADEPASAGGRSAPPPSLDEVFGDVLPDQTGDERGTDEWREAGRSRDDELRDDVPPHY